MKKMNKKGMSLVECIVAMGVFAVATTGFTMGATACMKSQAKSGRVLQKTNTQTTNLEHFSTYARVFDAQYANVKKMSSDANQWQMVFDFPGAGETVTNNNVFGYYSVIDEGDSKGIYQLSFFTAANTVALDPDEYWVTLYNYDTAQHTFDIECTDSFTFFDNEKNRKGTGLPRHIWAPDGGFFKFGVAKADGSADIHNCLIVKETREDASTTTTNLGLADYMPHGEMGVEENGDNMVYIYFKNGSFQADISDEPSDEG